MRRPWLLLGLNLWLGAAGFTAPPVLLPRGHAHNDYEHPRPLFDALDQGFCSVEADVYLVDGALLVAHERKDVKPERTLEALYLNPLHERARTNHGQIYPNQPEFTLLIDIKSDANATYAVLRPLLTKHADLLTRFNATEARRGAVTVILTGERPVEQVKAEPERLCAIDGRLEDLETNPSPLLVPLVSDSWRPTFAWFRDGQLPEADQKKLRELVAKAHAQGRRIRFWGGQDQPYAWRELTAAGVDLINTDNLAGLQAFFHLAGSEKP